MNYARYFIVAAFYISKEAKNIAPRNDSLLWRINHHGDGIVSYEEARFFISSIY